MVARGNQWQLRVNNDEIMKFLDFHPNKMAITPQTSNSNFNLSYYHPHNIWFLGATSDNQELIMLQHWSFQHYVPSAMFLVLWPQHYGPSALVPALWSQHYGPSAIVPALWSQLYGPSAMTPVLWPQWYGPSTMVWALWPQHYGPSAMALALWSRC